MKTGLIGAALVSAGSAALLLQAPLAHRGRGLLVLSEKEAGVLLALARRLCPELGPGAPGPDRIGLVSTVDAGCSLLDDESRQAFKVGLSIFDNAFTGAMFGERVRPFSRLDGASQDAVIHNWFGSRVAFRRTLMRGISSAIMAAYWGDPRTWSRIGYPGPPNPSGLRSAYIDNLVDLRALRAAPSAKET